MKRHITSLVASLIVCSLAAVASAQLPEGTKSDLGPDVPAFKVRPGFKVTRALANRKLAGIRFIQLSEDGKTLYVSDGRAGVIYALTDPDANGEFQTVTTFVKDRGATVQGMCTHDGWLYFSQAGEGSISRAKSTKGDGVADKIEYVVQPGGMPKGGGHPFEALFVTDKNIYATASDPQNMTPAPGHPDQDQPDRKTIYMFDLDGKNKQVFCTGVRNTEKLRYRPGTTEIYGFDNGTDRFGNTFGEKGKDQPITDLNPPEECNLYVQGGFYGHPYIVGNRQVRLEYADRKDIIELADKTIPPAWCVHAHWAVLGFTFLSKDYFGSDFKGDCFFCSHGSWNSSTPVGACVQQLMFDQLTGKPFGSLTIVDCFDGKKRWARPVDAAEMPDGTVVFSSDEPPALYRISKSKE